MPQSVSAVKRLSEFLHALAPKCAEGRAFSAVMSEELQIAVNDIPLLHTGYIAILELFQEAISEGGSIEDPERKEMFLAPIRHFHGIFKNETIKSGANRFHIEEPNLSKLKYAAEFINNSIEQPIADDILNGLMNNADDMIAQIVESALPRYLKQRLIEALEKVRFAILTYRLGGVKALRKATEEVSGVLVSNQIPIGESIKDNEPNKKTIFDLLTFIEKVIAVVEAATKLKELTAPLIQWFLTG